MKVEKSQTFQMMSEEKEYYLLVKKVFNVLAPFYDFGTAPISKVRDKVVDFTNAGNSSKILDVATGTGKQAFAFAEVGHEVVGIDLSKAMLRVAKRKNMHANVGFAISDATNLPFEDNSFDVTCVSFALHDMLFGIREKALREMVRVTKPKGMILIVDYGLPKNKVGRSFVYSFVRLYEGEYYLEFVKSDFKTLLKKSGIGIKEELPLLHGAVRVLKGTKMRYDRCQIRSKLSHTSERAMTPRIAIRPCSR